MKENSKTARDYLDLSNKNPFFCFPVEAVLKWFLLLMNKNQIESVSASKGLLTWWQYRCFSSSSTLKTRLFSTQFNLEWLFAVASHYGWRTVTRAGFLNCLSSTSVKMASEWLQVALSWRATGTLKPGLSDMSKIPRSLLFTHVGSIEAL